MSLRTKTRRLFGLTAATALAAAALAAVPATTPTMASSHREAPLISQDPNADITDVYAFVSPDAPTTVTLSMSVIPFEDPAGGPNYYRLADEVDYQINIDNDGDAIADLTYTVESTTTVSPTTTFLYNTGAITSLTDPDWVQKQTYKLTENNNGVSTVLGATLKTPPVNIGSKSTPNYDALASAAVETITAGSDTIKAFVGQRDDSFWVDLGAIFDLLTLRPQAAPVGYPTGRTVGIDGLAGYNVHSIILQVPITRLLSGAPNQETVIGVWATTSRPQTRVLNSPATVLTGGATGFAVHSGTPVQVARLAMPLVNEVVIPLALKDAFNGLDPSLDQPLYLASPASPAPFNTPPFIGAGNLLEKSIMNPELGRLLCGLYGVRLPREVGTTCNTGYTPGNPATGRSDIFEIFLQGIKLGSAFEITNNAGTKVPLPAGTVVNAHSKGSAIVAAEMIRLNTAFRPGPGGMCSATPNYQLGLLGGDACGFPNGRRPQDNTTYIELLAVAGAAWGVTTGDTTFTMNPALTGVLNDGVTRNDKPFGAVFPYLASPHQGQEHSKKGLSRAILTNIVR